MDCDSLWAKDIALFHGCTLVMRCLAEIACSTVRKLTNANLLQRCDTTDSDNDGDGNCDDNDNNNNNCIRTMGSNFVQNYLT